MISHFQRLDLHSMHYWSFPIVNRQQGQVVLVSIIRSVHTQRSNIYKHSALHLVDQRRLAL